MQHILRQSYRDPAWVAAFITVFISIWVIFTDDLINSDGVLYLEAAAQLLNGNWAASIELYKWPLYSLLIATVSKITLLDLEYSAYVVNVLTQTLLTFMFVRCAQALGGNKRVAIFAAILILTNVTMNGYRDQIIRDFGYWAFFFTALYFFLRYHQYSIPRYAIAFSVSMIVATLFRIEGIVFLLAAPLLILRYKNNYKTNLNHIFWLSSPVILLLVIGIIVLILNEAMLGGLGRIADPLIYLQNAYQSITIGIVEKGKILETYVLLDGARNMGTESMLAILFMMLVLKIISASGYIPLFFSILGYANRSIYSRMESLRVLHGFLIINLLVLIVFLLSNSFLSPRYTMTMALLIMLPAAFVLSDFMEVTSTHKKWIRRGKTLVIVMLVYMFLDGMTSFGASKSYIREAGQWLHKNTSAEPRILANERAIYYYAKRPVDTDAISQIVKEVRTSKVMNIDINSYDYIAIKVGRKQIDYKTVLINQIGNEPVYQSKNKRGDMVLIFKTKN